MLPRIPEWYELLLGMFRRGVVPMPATTLCTARDIAQRIERAQATVAVVDDEAAAKLAEVRDQCPSLRHVIVVGDAGRGRATSATTTCSRAPATPSRRRAPTRADDPLLLYFTSGTVAAPKMVLHTHASMGAGHEITARFWQDLTPADLHWTFSDTGWAKAAWGKLFGQWRMGAAVFLWDQRGKLDPELCLRVLERSGVTTFCAPPTLFRAFVQLDLGAFDLARVRHTVSAGEPLNPEVIRAWREATGTTIYDGYGQTETVNLVANFPCLEVRPGSMGKPTPGNDVDVVSDDGERLGPGEEGNIALATEPERPVGLMQGYWRDDDANAEVFHDGWYFTGDRAVKDEDGYLWFVSRSDDVIISASYRIGPFEVESALVEHPAVVESAVVGKPDPDAHEHRQGVRRARARATRASDALARELQEHVKSVTAPYKYPREIEFVDALPKTISGKIRRSELRAARVTRAAAVRDRALLRGARVRRAVPAVRLRRRGALAARAARATPTTRRATLWDGLVLGYTETLGSPLLRARDRGPLRDARGRRRDRRRRRERGALPPLLGARAARAITSSRCGRPTSRSTTSRARRAPRSSSSSCGPRTAGRSTSTASPPRCGPTTRAVVVNLPHNPTGMHPSAARVRRARRARRAPRRDARLRRGLPRARAGSRPPGCPRPPTARRAPSASACSRSRTRWPGLRVGWLATRDRDLLDAVAQVRDYTSLCSPAPSEVLGVDRAARRRRAARAQPRHHRRQPAARRRADGRARRAARLGAARSRARSASRATAAPRASTPSTSASCASRACCCCPGRVYGYGDGRFRLGFGRRNLPEAVERLDRQLRA